MSKLERFGYDNLKGILVNGKPVEESETPKSKTENK